MYEGLLVSFLWCLFVLTGFDFHYFVFSSLRFLFELKDVR